MCFPRLLGFVDRPARARGSLERALFISHIVPRTRGRKTGPVEKNGLKGHVVHVNSPARAHRRRRCRNARSLSRLCSTSVLIMPPPSLLPPSSAFSRILSRTFPSRSHDAAGSCLPPHSPYPPAESSRFFILVHSPPLPPRPLRGVEVCPSIIIAPSCHSLPPSLCRLVEVCDASHSNLRWLTTAGDKSPRKLSAPFLIRAA